MTDDGTLLRRYLEERSQDAFAELVGRHIDLVYSSAVRRLGGDRHRAADVAQTVFVALAREAPALSQHPALTAWLYTATRNAAFNVLRAERRRRQREAEAMTMNELRGEPDTAVAWERLRPALDAAMDELAEADRTAVLLRFFEQRSFAEIGKALRVSEDAARMRTDRALEKLRVQLAGRGVTSGATALAAALGTGSVVAAPVELVARIAGAVAVKATTTAGLAGGIAALMNTTNLSATIAVGAAVVALGVAFFQFNAEQYAEALAASARSETKALAARVDSLRARLHRDQASVTSVRSVAAPAGTAAVTRPAGTDDAAELGRVFLMDHPELRPSVDAMRHKVFEQNWGVALRAIGLSAVERLELDQRAAESVPCQFRVNTPVGSWGTGPGSTDSGMQASDEYARHVWELLGPQRQQPFLDAYALKPVYELAQTLAVGSYEAGVPLGAGQVEAFLRAVNQHGAERRTIVGGAFPGATMMDLRSVDWTAVSRDLQATWSQPQLAALETARRVSAADTQLRSTMRKLPAAASAEVSQ